MSERSRKEWREFIEQENKAQAAIARKLEQEAEIEKIKQEISANACKLQAVNRRLKLGYREQPYISPELQNRFFNDADERDAFNRNETREFVKENPEWSQYNNAANIALLLEYYEQHGITTIDRTMLRSAFLLLKNSGLLEPNPAPVPEFVPTVATASQPQEEDFSDLPRLPAWHQEPIAYRRETQSSYIGLDPETGREREFSELEVSQMSGDLFARVFGVKTKLALTRINFLR